MRHTEDYIFAALAGLLGLAAVLIVAGMFWLAGYWVGLYSLPCAAESSQPHCVKQGWGTHNDVDVEVKR